ncbi:MAG: hypothetical protein QW732_00885 [Zestosphaera sp.]
MVLPVPSLTRKAVYAEGPATLYFNELKELIHDVKSEFYRSSTKCYYAYWKWSLVEKIER